MVRQEDTNTILLTYKRAGEHVLAPCQGTTGSAAFPEMRTASQQTEWQKASATGVRRVT